MMPFCMFPVGLNKRAQRKTTGWEAGGFWIE